MNTFLLGAFAMTSVVASLSFYRFWRQTRDRFVLFFSISLLVAGVDRIILAFSNLSAEREPELYPVRVLTYALRLHM